MNANALDCLQTPNAAAAFIKSHHLDTPPTSESSFISNRTQTPSSLNSQEQTADNAADSVLNNKHMLKDLEALIGNMEQNQAKQNQQVLDSIQSMLQNMINKKQADNSIDAEDMRITMKSPILGQKHKDNSLKKEQNPKDVKNFVWQHIQEIVPNLVQQVEQELMEDDTDLMQKEEEEEVNMQQATAALEPPPVNADEFIMEEVIKPNLKEAVIREEAPVEYVYASEIANFRMEFDRGLDRVHIMEWQPISLKQADREVFKMFIVPEIKESPKDEKNIVEKSAKESAEAEENLMKKSSIYHVENLQISSTFQESAKIEESPKTDANLSELTTNSSKVISSEPSPSPSMASTEIPLDEKPSTSKAAAKQNQQQSRLPQNKQQARYKRRAEQQRKQQARNKTNESKQAKDIKEMSENKKEKSQEPKEKQEISEIISESTALSTTDNLVNNEHTKNETNATQTLEKNNENIIKSQNEKLNLERNAEVEATTISTLDHAQVDNKESQAEITEIPKTLSALPTEATELKNEISQNVSRLERAATESPQSTKRVSRIPVRSTSIKISKSSEVPAEPQNSSLESSSLTNQASLDNEADKEADLSIKELQDENIANEDFIDTLNDKHQESTEIPLETEELAAEGSADILELQEDVIANDDLIESSINNQQVFISKSEKILMSEEVATEDPADALQLQKEVIPNEYLIESSTDNQQVSISNSAEIHLQSEDPAAESMNDNGKTVVPTAELSKSVEETEISNHIEETTEEFQDAHELESDTEQEQSANFSDNAKLQDVEEQSSDEELYSLDSEHSESVAINDNDRMSLQSPNSEAGEMLLLIQDNMSENANSDNEIISSITNKSSSPLKSSNKQNLNEMVEDTQRLIKQMKDEISLADFESSEEEYTDEYSDEYTEDSEEYTDYEGEEEQSEYDDEEDDEDDEEDDQPTHSEIDELQSIEEEVLNDNPTLTQNTAEAQETNTISISITNESNTNISDNLDAEHNIISNSIQGEAKQSSFIETQTAKVKSAATAVNANAIDITESNINAEYNTVSSSLQTIDALGKLLAKTENLANEIPVESVLNNLETANSLETNNTEVETINSAVETVTSPQKQAASKSSQLPPKEVGYSQESEQPTTSTISSNSQSEQAKSPSNAAQNESTTQIPNESSQQSHMAAEQPSTSQANKAAEQPSTSQATKEKTKTPAASKIPKPKDIAKKLPKRSKSFSAPSTLPQGISSVKALQQEFLQRQNKLVLNQREGLKPPPPTAPKKSISEAISKFSAATASKLTFDGPSTSGLFKPRTHPRIPKKKYHETCFSDDDFETSSSNEEPEPPEVRERKKSVPVFRTYASIKEPEIINSEVRKKS